MPWKLGYLAIPPLIAVLYFVNHRLGGVAIIASLFIGFLAAVFASTRDRS